MRQGEDRRMRAGNRATPNMLNSLMKMQPLVPLAGIEPALLAESDFESDASTSSAIGARARRIGAI